MKLPKPSARALGIIVLSGAILAGLLTFSTLVWSGVIYPPQKQEILDQAQKDRAENRTKPKPPILGPPSAPAKDEPRSWPTGISSDCNAPLPSAEYQIKNCWAGLVGDIFLNVYAGAQGPEGVRPGDGILFVQETTMQLQISGVQYETPHRTGPLTILSAEGDMLTLQTEGGTQFIFSVQTRSLERV